jgi:hypothetical protein
MKKCKEVQQWLHPSKSGWQSLQVDISGAGRVEPLTCWPFYNLSKIRNPKNTADQVGPPPVTPKYDLVPNAYSIVL